MKLHRFRIWALLAAVLLGQWVTLAHASQHLALEPVSDALCAVCASGIGSGSAPAADLPKLIFAANGAAPATLLPQALTQENGAPPRNRGPPQHS